MSLGDSFSRAPGFGEGGAGPVNASHHKFVDRPAEKKHWNVRCPDCGCWASLHRQRCYHCGREVGAEKQHRRAHEQIARAPGLPAARGCVAVNASHHHFRDGAPELRHAKVRCPSCGCWAARGARCYQCGGVAPKEPKLRRAHEQIQRAPGFGSGPYRSVHQHKFRDLDAQVPDQRVRCPGCGLWGSRGAPCRHCPERLPRRASRSRSPIERTPGFGPGDAPAGAVHAHKFRETSPDRPHLKVRCPSCGCWATRGGDCYQCGQPAPWDPRQRRPHEIIARTPGIGDERGGAGGGSTFTHHFRDPSPEKKHLKVRCASCGCWAQRGAPCYQCGQLAAKEPRALRPAEMMARAPGLGVGSGPLSVHQHKFRDSAVVEQRHAKIKCRGCGCWGRRAASCYFCGQPLPAGPRAGTTARSSTPSGSPPRTRFGTPPRTGQRSRSQELRSLSSYNPHSTLSHSADEAGPAVRDTKASQLRRRTSQLQVRGRQYSEVQLRPPEPLDDVVHPDLDWQGRAHHPEHSTDGGRGSAASPALYASFGVSPPPPLAPAGAVSPPNGPAEIG
eukprot:TRINITY_DN47264_c0_g1_i1.p1 TRINITY_DN47264_c0_g1~~TRINITY_DN47264_c0_g1_i1.p1  ORF type:complete len:589 (+),score=127.11 TRINITY_DN47264_c0_g1_i1:91-1767(+)